jgi:hypothetical protein
MADEYQINITDFVPHIQPSEYGIENIKTINPNDYFITSGDAVVKATVLEKDMWTLAGKIRKELGKSKDKKHKEFISSIWSAAGKCRVLLHHLKEIRGTAIFAETEWRDHKLIIIPKNPKGHT